MNVSLKITIGEVFKRDRLELNLLKKARLLLLFFSMDSSIDWLFWDLLTILCLAAAKVQKDWNTVKLDEKKVIHWWSHSTKHKRRQGTRSNWRGKKSFIDLLKKFYGRRQNKHFQYQSKAETEKEIIAFKKTWKKGDKTTPRRSIQGGEIFPWHNFTR